MDNKDKKDNGKLPKHSQTILMLVAAVIATLFLLSAVSNLTRDDSSRITYSEMITMAEKGEIDSVYVDNSNDRIKITLTNEATAALYKDNKSEDNTLTEEYVLKMLENGSMEAQVYYTGIPTYESVEERLSEYGVTVDYSIPDTNSAILDFLLVYVLPILLFWFLISFMMKRAGGGGGVMGVGKSNAKMYVQKETGVTFKDVAGEDEAKESLVEIVDFLHNPGKYADIGAKLPKGALLVGPPGTGKTLLAKAVAGEAEVPFFSISGSDFVEMFVGVGASRVRDLFKQAQNNAPCIIFIDEIDAIGKSRDSRLGGNDEREQTLNQLLAEMDGFDSSKGVFILAATNRPEILDKALLRPGRFDRRIIVERPDLKGRVEILKVHSRNVKMDDTVDFNEIALATSGAVGSDLANMINEAAINAVKKGRQAISQKDLFEAVEVVLVGKEKKDRILSKEERKIVSYHEVGHALISALQKDSEPVQKITIVPRTMGALGYVMNVPEEEKYLNTESELKAMLVEFMGGRAAEEIVFGNVTTGASNDIEKATNIAKAMVTQYGMSEEFGLMALATVENQYLTGRASLNCGDITASQIDEVVKRMLAKAYAEAKEMLSGHRDTLDQIAAFLIERESITGKEFMEIFHRIEGGGEQAAEEPAGSDETSSQAAAAEHGASDLTVKAEDPVNDQPVITRNSADDQPENTENDVCSQQSDTENASGHQPSSAESLAVYHSPSEEEKKEPPYISTDEN